MTILQEDPVALSLTLFDQDLSLLTLALPKRNQIQMLVVIFGQFVQHLCGIRSRTQDENDRRPLIGVPVHFLHGGGRHLIIKRTQLVGYIRREGLHQFFRSEGLDDEQLVKGVHHVISGQGTLNWEALHVELIVCGELLPINEVHLDVLN